LERKLSVFSSLGVIISIILIGSLVFTAVYKVSGIDDICLSPTCIEESSRVHSYMKKEADPCHDFYKFACQTFIETTTIPDEKNEVTSFNQQYNLKQQLREIVKEPIQDDEIEPFKNVKRLYRACLNVSLIESRGITPVINVLDSMEGGWPVVHGKSWPKSNWTWQKSVVSSKTNGYSTGYFINIFLRSDSNNSSKRIVQIDEPSLGLSREYLVKRLKEPFVQAYNDYQVDLAVLFGADRSFAEEEMKQVLNFEIALAEITTTSEERREIENFYNPMNLTELQEKYDYQGHEWLNFLNDILPADSQLDVNDTIVVGSTTYFEQLGTLLSKTSRRVLANYVMWRHAKRSVAYLPRLFRDRQHEYNRQKTGSTSNDIRWMQCIENTLNNYPHALGALYVRKHFDPNAKEQALEIVNNIREEFKILLDEVEWMDDETKREAKEKAEMIEGKIGYADELLDDSKLVEYYDAFPVKIDENEYYESSFRLNVAQFNKNQGRLREPVDRNDWTLFPPPTDVNAYYQRVENSIKFPAGILQRGIFFNNLRPHYMNYGAIGFIIGHEITHGFDDVGRRFDGNGNLRDWWKNETKEAFLEKAQCIIDQYGSYIEPMTKLQLNGVRTLGENIADNGGIKLAYRAYNRWAETNSEQKLPGLKYTPQQMFWISSAQIWCNVARNETMRNKIMTNVHSPGEFRVLGPFSNSKEFSEDFKCLEHARMNPTSKCEVW